MSYYIRNAAETDLPILNDLCLRTADFGADISDEMTLVELPGAMFTDPYLLYDASACFVLARDVGTTGAAASEIEHTIPTAQGQIEQVCGYIVGCRDTQAFQQWFVRDYRPARLDQLGLAQMTCVEELEGATARDRKYASWLLGAGQTVAPWVERYPAHLHINLAEQARGQGWGRRLIETFFSEMSRSGVRGVHLGVGALNTSAIAFYEAMGMHRISQEGDGVIMARELVHSR